ncbi:uncharacterized protein LOC106671140 isoform X2 [Cimex lectularius]|nr:uncharacterized protein LOC106671140 isoform X2 [Cimex lectularius]
MAPRKQDAATNTSKKRKFFRPKDPDPALGQNATPVEKKTMAMPEDDTEVKFLVPKTPLPISPVAKPQTAGLEKRQVKKADAKSSSRKRTTREITKREVDTVLHYFALNPIFDKL